MKGAVTANTLHDFEIGDSVVVITQRTGKVLAKVVKKGSKYLGVRTVERSEYGVAPQANFLVQPSLAAHAKRSEDDPRETPEPSKFSCGDRVAFPLRNGGLAYATVRKVNRKTVEVWSCTYPELDCKKIPLIWLRHVEPDEEESKKRQEVAHIEQQWEEQEEGKDRWKSGFWAW